MSTQPAESHSGTATILFTDLVGSTALRTRLGEERAEGQRRAHHRLLAQVVATRRETVQDDLERDRVETASRRIRSFKFRIAQVVKTAGAMRLIHWGCIDCGRPIGREESSHRRGRSGEGPGSDVMSSRAQKGL
jgi:class 3 adenylate cyclase